MKKGLTVVILIFIYFFSFTNVFAMEETILPEEENIIETEEKETFLTELTPDEVTGEYEIVEKEIDEEIYDKSISGKEFELTYNNDEYKSLNFIVQNNDEETPTKYEVIVDEQPIYIEELEKTEEREVKLNITGDRVIVTLDGDGSYLNPYFSTEKNTYTITYDKEETITTDESIYTIRDEEEKIGYTFKNYIDDNKREYHPNEDIYLSNDLNLESVYEEEVYTVTYKMFNDYKEENYTINNNSLFIPEYKDYNFLGWYDINGNKIENLYVGNIILFGKFERIEQPIYEVKKLNYIETNYSYETINTSSTQVEIDNKKEENIENKIISTEQIDTPFNSQNVKLNFLLILGILILLIAVFIVLKQSLETSN